MRWFGPGDAVSLKDIRQAGATGVVTALHQVPVGNVWTIDDIRERKNLISSEGMTWSVVESLPVHEDIKKRSGNYRTLIENYKKSLINLAECGINRVVYNFMPVLDWVRTDHNFVNEDGSSTLSYTHAALIYFDTEILNRPGASESYSGEELQLAAAYGEILTKDEKEYLTRCILLGLPGASENFNLDALGAMIREYNDISEDDLRENLYYFLGEVCPVADELDVYLSIHPDDPPFPVLGLPRIASTRNDISRQFERVGNKSNTLCFCTGSFGAGQPEELPDMLREFSGRIQFFHLRNVTKQSKKDFRESEHLKGDVDMLSVMNLAIEEMHRGGEELPMRPDHGFLLESDRTRSYYPGYSYLGRVKALAELRGIETALRNLQG